MTEKLPTKSELMAEMQAHVDYIKNGYSGLSIRVEQDKDLNQFWFMFESFALGNARAYREDLTAPADGHAVIVGKDGMLRVSKGTFSDTGLLQTYEDKESGLYNCTGWENWCDYLNRDHHSDGWEKEWEIIQ